MICSQLCSFLHFFLSFLIYPKSLSFWASQFKVHNSIFALQKFQQTCRYTAWHSQISSRLLFMQNRTDRFGSPASGSGITENSKYKIEGRSLLFWFQSIAWFQFRPSFFLRWIEDWEAWRLAPLTSSAPIGDIGRSRGRVENKVESS